MVYEWIVSGSQVLSGAAIRRRYGIASSSGQKALSGAVQDIAFILSSQNITNERVTAWFNSGTDVSVLVRL